MLAHLQSDTVRTVAEEPQRVVCSVTDAAAILDCSRRTVYEMIRRGELTSYKIGRLTKVRIDEVLALVGGEAA